MSAQAALEKKDTADGFSVRNVKCAYKCPMKGPGHSKCQ